MPEMPAEDDLLDRLGYLTRLLKEHQAYLFALHTYLQEQPSYQPSRFGTLYALQRQRMQLPGLDVPPEAALHGLLRE
jgi:hypothetical protein